MKQFLILVMALIIGSAAWAQAPAPKKEEKKKAWYETIALKGDFRLRLEGFDQSGAEDRLRERFRLRLGLESKLGDNTKFTLGLRTGDTSDPVSDNQTFSDGFTKKGFYIAEAYLNWKPSSNFWMSAGKFPWKGNRIYADIEWDDDVNVEGLAETLRFSSGKAPGVTEHAFNLGFFQTILLEQSSKDETFLFGFQPHYEMKSDSMSLIIGATYEEYMDPSYLAKSTYDKKLGGNPLTNAYTMTEDGKFDVLRSDFEIVNGFVEFKAGKFGLKGHYFINNGAYNDQDTAYFLRASYGSIKATGDWELRYTHYYMEAESLLYTFVQSDATIGTNSESSRFDFTYVTTQWSTLGATLWLTDRIDGDYENLTRFQIDYIIKI